MKTRNLAATCLLALLCVPASAQLRFAGTYDLGSGYETGETSAGLFSYGVATAARDGTVAYTVYCPRTGDRGAGSGTISKNGTFSLNNGVSGTVKLVSRTIDAIGDFVDPFGSGFFAMSKK